MASIRQATDCEGLPRYTYVASVCSPIPTIPTILFPFLQELLLLLVNIIIISLHNKL